MWKATWILLVCLGLPACQRAQPAQRESPPVVTLGDGSAARNSVRATQPPADYLAGTHWPSARLHEGAAWVSCVDAYATQGDGHPVASMDFLALVDLLSPCKDTGLVRLRYRGNIGPGFTALVERVDAIAGRMAIRERILDIDSTGGQVEEALQAGDAIAGSHWAIWVREGSICHSACVLVLASGDTRSIAGKVGIHRLMRQRSMATTRRELNAELQDITAQVRDFLSRNGVAGALADQMMTIPNRDLRVLTPAELTQYGLSGSNAVQDDLDRITLMRQCGDDYVSRRDAFMRVFDSACMKPGQGAESMQSCGHELEQRFGFPDPHCSGQSPMNDYAQRLGRALPPFQGGRSRVEKATATTGASD
ncbi:MAG: hypothetical protein JWL98_851 [Xanthomonadaceae bacterium]|nr:hypothetical protein [Xanthomonadaceae bacterium]